MQEEIDALREALRSSRADNAELVRALRTVERVLLEGSPAITDTIWVGPGETLLDVVQHALGSKG